MTVNVAIGNYITTYGSQSPVMHVERTQSFSNPSGSQVIASAVSTGGLSASRNSPLGGTVKADIDIYVAVNGNPTAQTDNGNGQGVLVFANQTYSFAVYPNDQIAVINAVGAF